MASTYMIYKTQQSDIPLVLMGMLKTVGPLDLILKLFLLGRKLLGSGETHPACIHRLCTHFLTRHLPSLTGKYNKEFMINNTNHTISKTVHTTWWKISGIMTLYINTMKKKML